MTDSYLAIPPILGFVGLLVALGIYLIVNRFPEGNESVKTVSYTHLTLPTKRIV